MCNCPECGSGNVRVQPDEEQLRSYYHCCDCGNEWSRVGINRKGENTPKAKNPYTIPAVCLAAVLLMFAAAFTGGKSVEASQQGSVAKIETAANTSHDISAEPSVETTNGLSEDTANITKDVKESQEETGDKTRQTKPEEKELFTLAMVPEYSGNAYVDINNDVPFFTEDELTEETFQEYWPLDDLGRCTGAFACIGPDSLPKETRESTSSIKPTGWQSVQYESIDGGYLYNRCHLIGYQLTGQSVNEKNLITGTRYMNVEGMLPFENSVQMYVEGTGHHVLYRVRPYYNGDDLLAAGVLMEAKSIEDPLVQFCAFCYNVQPGIDIDYATGFSKASETTGSEEILAIVGDSETGDDESVTRSIEDESQTTSAEDEEITDEDEEEVSEEEPEEITYVLNTNTKKFHTPYCSSVKDMKDKNKKETTMSREEVISQGYTPCKRCKP